ncbi:MAG: AraC family transcriptional regulator, partial [bacterium]
TLERLAGTHLRPLTHHDYAAYEIPRMMRKILYEQRVQADGHVPAIQAALLNLVVALNRIYQNIPVTKQSEPENPTVARIRKVADYISTNFYEAISVDNMAKMACLSVRQFTNQFKAVHGVTFMQYLHYQRVRFAQKLLAETDQQIVSICFECGFNDLAHFYRVFKKIANLSPRKYRLNSRAGIISDQHPRPAAEYPL